MSTEKNAYALVPIGYIRSSLKHRAEAPRQGNEGAPAAQIELLPAFAAGLEGLRPGDELIVVTWLHQARRDVLQVHPRNDLCHPLTGVFLTRSPDRPNPLGFHRVAILAIEFPWIHIGPIEAIDGTPIVDLKPILSPTEC